MKATQWNGLMKPKTRLYELSFRNIKHTLEYKTNIWTWRTLDKDEECGYNQQEVVRKVWRIALIIIVKNGSDNNGGSVFQGCEYRNMKAEIPTMDDQIHCQGPFKSLECTLKTQKQFKNKYKN